MQLYDYSDMHVEVARLQKGPWPHHVEVILGLSTEDLSSDGGLSMADVPCGVTRWWYPWIPKGQWAVILEVGAEWVDPSPHPRLAMIEAIGRAYLFDAGPVIPVAKHDRFPLYIRTALEERHLAELPRAPRRTLHRGPSLEPLQEAFLRPVIEEVLRIFHANRPRKV